MIAIYAHPKPQPRQAAVVPPFDTPAYRHIARLIRDLEGLLSRIDRATERGRGK